MATVTAPLLSLDASGTVAKTLVFTKTGKNNVVYTKKNYSRVSIPGTLYQDSWREYMGRVMAIRKSLSVTEFEQIKELALRSRLSAHHYFMSQYLLLRPSDLGNTVLGLSELGQYDISL